MQYFVEMYMTLYTYGSWVFWILATMVSVGGLGLLLTMADNGQKGTMDFSIEHMSAGREKYSSLISLWKKALGVFVVVAALAIFAPSQAVLAGWTNGGCVATSK